MSKLVALISASNRTFNPRLFDDYANFLKWMQETGRDEGFEVSAEPFETAPQINHITIDPEDPYFIGWTIDGDADHKHVMVALHIEWEELPFTVNISPLAEEDDIAEIKKHPLWEVLKQFH